MERSGKLILPPHWREQLESILASTTKKEGSNPEKDEKGNDPKGKGRAKKREYSFREIGG